MYNLELYSLQEITKAIREFRVDYTICDLRKDISDLGLKIMILTDDIRYVRRRDLGKLIDYIANDKKEVIEFFSVLFFI